MVADFLWDEGKIVGLIERRCDQDRRSPANGDHQRRTTFHAKRRTDRALPAAP